MQIPVSFQLPINPLAPMGNLPNYIGKVAIGAKRCTGSWNDTSICIILYSFVPVIFTE